MQITGNNHWLNTYHLPFSWSYSRGQAFIRCQRQYYYRYYAPYGRNAPDEEGDRAYIQTLGRLTSAAELLGDIVHRTARDRILACRSGRSWEDATDIAAARVALHQALRRSESACRKGLVSPRQTTLLAHFYGYPLDEAALSSQLDLFIHNLLDHGVFQNGISSPESILLVDQMRQFNLGGVRVFAVPDVLLKTSRYHLVDWKTGRVSGPRLDEVFDQLWVYALFVSRTERVPASAIDCEVAELASGTSHLRTASDNELVRIEEYIRGSIAEMQSLLQDTAANQAGREDFPRRATVPPGDAVCAHCSFRVLCFGTPPEPH